LQFLLIFILLIFRSLSFRNYTIYYLEVWLCHYTVYYTVAANYYTVGANPPECPTKTSTLNPHRIHEIYVHYVDEHLFMKYLHGSHVDTFHVDEILVSISRMKYFDLSKK